MRRLKYGETAHYACDKWGGSFNVRSNTISVHLQSPNSMTYRIFTVAGHEVFHASEFLTKGAHSLRIDKPHLAQGAYIVHFRAGGESMRWRMVVKNSSYTGNK